MIAEGLVITEVSDSGVYCTLGEVLKKGLYGETPPRGASEQQTVREDNAARLLALSYTAVIRNQVS